ncbi:MAG: hypothetical protein ABSD63_13535 [Candidatus Korobacteraceae bacterium]|jgi:hypothetical protein
MLHSIGWLDQHAGAIQAISALLIVILTALLVCATIKYVRSTSKALEISRAQFAEMVRVEVFVRVGAAQKTSATEFEGKVEMANLSGRGIWWEKISVGATFRGQSGPPVEKVVNKIVPPYVMESVSAEETFFQAFQKIEQHAKYNGHVSVTASYKANGRWLTEKCESPEMFFSPNCVFIEDSADPFS